jgi:LPXTG-site transpeptidase (sortase) family protein
VSCELWRLAADVLGIHVAGQRDFLQWEFGEVTSVPGQVGRQVACGLVAIIAAVSVALAGESSAGAAIVTHSPRSHRVAAKRDIRLERILRDIRNPGHAARPGERRPGRHAGRHATRTAPGPAARPAPRHGAKRARPWTITVPSIGVATDLMKLGDPVGGTGLDGLSLPVPPLAKAATAAGWYQFTAVPGAEGNAVIAGHVDTYVGPAVFYDLYLLRPGDRVYVDAGGARQRFDVTSVSELPKPNFPVNQVFGGTTRHMLWLITCGGAFDYQTGHYLSNIVVSATWIPPEKKHRDKKEQPKRHG